MHAPDNDTGVIIPAAAVSSFPCAREQAMRALHHFYDLLGPAVIMVRNCRTGLLWELFMTDPDVRTCLKRLGFFSYQKAR